MSQEQGSAEKSEQAVIDASSTKHALVLALIVGFVGVVGISLFTHWYEVVVMRSYYAPSVGLTIPPLVFALFAIVLVVNGLLRKLAPVVCFKRRELLAILALWLVTSTVCYIGLVQPATMLIGTAQNKDIAKPLSTHVNVYQYFNGNLFLNAKDSSDFYYGISDGMSRVSLLDIPWGKWLTPAMFWLPFALAAVILMVALVKMVHRQWSKHELLTYPLADFSSTLITYRQQRSLPDICYDPMFLWGVGIVCFLYLVNGLHSWFPLMVEIPLSYRHTEIIKSFPFIQKYCGVEGYSLFRGMLYPLVVAIAFLLPTEISFSCWAGWVLMVLGTGFFFLTTGEVIGATETGFISSGMYVAMGIAIVFIGRKEYWSILKHTVCGAPGDDPLLKAAVTACRFFLAAFVAMIIGLLIAGLDLYTSLFFVVAFSLVTILMARFTAETGIPWLVCFAGKAVYFPLSILGMAAIGPKSIAVLTTVGAVFAIGLGTSNAIASQGTTYEKVAEKTYTPAFRKWMNVILLLGLVVALVVSAVGSLSDNYSYGASMSRNNWPYDINSASKKINRLNIEGISEEVAGYSQSAPSRLAHIQPVPGFWKYFLLGGVIIAVCMFMRLRFTWWPFHPLPLLLVNEWCLSRLYVSFLVGWAIKVAILKTGGGKVFTRTKPLFMGVIIGQCLISGMWILVNVCYYLATDTMPPRISIFP